MNPPASPGSPVRVSPFCPARRGAGGWAVLGAGSGAGAGGKPGAVGAVCAVCGSVPNDTRLALGSRLGPLSPSESRTCFQSPFTEHAWGKLVISFYAPELSLNSPSQSSPTDAELFTCLYS